MFLVMPSGLQRFQESGQPHSVTFSCYRRQPLFATPELFDHFVRTLEGMRRHFQMCVYGYVVMPEHVHLLLNEPPRVRLAEAIHYSKLPRGAFSLTAVHWHSTPDPRPAGESAGFGITS